MQALTDHDLVLLEPGIFTDALAAATVLHSGADGSVTDASLDSAGSDFASLGIDESHVVVINGKPAEVVARVGTTQLTVSLPRADAGQAPIAPGDGTSLAFQIPTFARLIERVRRRVLAGIGLDPDGADAEAGEVQLVNEGDVRHLIGMECIAEAFAIASGANPTDVPLAARAELYARRAAGARQRLAARMDLDGDGAADATRRPAVIILRRV